MLAEKGLMSLFAFMVTLFINTHSVALTLPSFSHFNDQTFFSPIPQIVTKSLSKLANVSLTLTQSQVCLSSTVRSYYFEPRGGFIWSQLLKWLQTYHVQRSDPDLADSMESMHF